MKKTIALLFALTLGLFLQAQTFVGNMNIASFGHKNIQCGIILRNIVCPPREYNSGTLLCPMKELRIYRFRVIIGSDNHQVGLPFLQKIPECSE